MDTEAQPQDDAPDGAPGASPKTSPEAMTLRAAPRPVMRLNRRMLMVLVGGLAAAVLGGTLWSLQSTRRQGGEPTELYNVDRIARSEGLEQLPADYSKLPAPEPPPVLGEPLPGDLGRPMLRAEQQASYAQPGNDPAEAERLARLKEAEEAAQSSVFFRSGSTGQRQAAAAPAAAAAPSANQPFNPMGAGLASAAPRPADPTAVQNRQDQKEAFLEKAGSTETRHSGTLQMPASPYQVMAGAVISAALVTGIKSDLPGDVIATVTEPVYDSATGHHMLIPQNSRLMGKYNSQVSYGQSRVQVVWNRVILPDTTSISLDNLVGSDPAGYAGLEDGVDWHWDRVFAGAALTTLLGVGAELAAPENRTDGNRIIIAGRDSMQDSVNQAGQEMTRRNMNIQPTLTIRPGAPVRIVANKDLVLQPYQPLFYQRGSSR
ncbi:TrbI/VirB10 family protein [Pigmentiphaga sp.]|uniref:TrbI/VirB10 family protein n=1 Tax=Pigmentiphaga sp. TaxID=1977564 RepID=UPI0025FD9F13|nr:TrbI/VirB10 family protein [Pigmentiphaga sp.]